MSEEIWLVCVGIIFMGIEIFFVGIIFMSVDSLFFWYYFHGCGNFVCVGHMFESLLNEFMEMRDFWVDWDIVRMSWNLNLRNGIWGLTNFFRGIILLVGILE